ncbi:hypothetical protein RO21_06020 [[Actinobacillus] muris]|uniref:Phage protein n=1 Tax=Muribacter muris TaxID=67855 RepID=A0A0J5P4W4_9PAST|nr:putative phage tail assembly chaperone [Muribacter muris]KMK51468.1 hypothetical protein RO21_06020 [[Actinobacillus] muris] [Muribacter muris]
MEKPNEAVSLLDKLGIKIKNHVVLTVGDTDFRFNLDPAAYDAFVNDVDTKNKITPMRDYLLATVEPNQRDDLAELLQVPGLTTDLFGEVREALLPKINITVKN